MIRHSNEGITFSVDICNALMAFASKDETRFHLCGIALDDMAHLAATDGHTAVRFLGCDPGGTQPMTHALTVWSAEYVKVQLAVAKASKAPVTLEWTKAMDAKFPPLSQVMPAERMTATAPIGLNADYLARIAKVVKACGHNAECALVGASDPLSPVLFTVEGLEFTAEVVIMPMRLRHAAESAEMRRAA